MAAQGGGGDKQGNLRRSPCPCKMLKNDKYFLATFFARGGMWGWVGGWGGGGGEPNREFKVYDVIQDKKLTFTYLQEHRKKLRK